MSRVLRTEQLHITPYYDGGYEGLRDEIGSVLADLSVDADVSFDDLAHIDEFEPESPTNGVAAVFAAAAESVPERIEPPTVWVTPDPDAAADAVAAGAADAVTWRPGDGTGLLAAKLSHLSPPIPGSEGSAPPRRGAAARRAVERIDEGIIEIDPEGRITYLNDAAASMIGDSRARAMGESVWTLLSERAISEVRSAVERAWDGDAPVTTDLATPDGRAFEVTLYPDDDRLSATIARVDDGTRRSDRTMYEHLVKTVGDAVYIVDDEGRFTFVNDALCEMTGYDREELIGSSVHIIKDDATVAEAEDALRDLLRRRGDAEEMPIAKLDVELVRKDGTRVPCTDRMTLRPLEDGEFTGTVGTLRDVSRQRRRERILNNLLEATQDMIAAETTEDVAERVVDVAMNTIDTDGAVVRKHDPETDRLEPVAVPDAVRERMGDRPAYDAEEGPAGTAFTDARTVTVEDPDHLTAGVVEEGTYLPIGDDRVLSVSHDKSGAVMDDERQFLELLAATAESVFDRVERDQERRRYEAVVETADDMLFTLDADGVFTLVTESFASMLGRSRSDLVGTPIDDVLVDEAIAEDLVVVSGGSRVTETELRPADGPGIPTRISVAPITGPTVDGVVGSVQDIRELRLAEQEASRQRRRFAELFGTLTDPLIELEFEGADPTVVTANQQFVELADASGDELQNAPLPEITGALPSPIEDALDAVATRRDPVEREITVRTDAGARFYLLRSVPYRNEDRERAFVVLTDITEVKQQGTHLQVLHRLLRHNLRNQTNVIHGRAGIIRERTGDDEVESHAERIEAASRSLLDTSETAQSVQRILRGEQETPEPIPNADLRDRLERLADSVAAGTDIHIEVVADTPVPYDDPIESAITELLDNAVEYGTPDDDSSVEIRVTDRPDDRVRIAVADDGSGIPEEEWSVVAGDREITQLQHASGLGLWLAKWVADRHGGDLELLGFGVDGTTVAIDLPAE